MKSDFFLHIFTKTRHSKKTIGVSLKVTSSTTEVTNGTSNETFFCNNLKSENQFFENRSKNT